MNDDNSKSYHSSGTSPYGVGICCAPAVNSKKKKKKTKLRLKLPTCAFTSGWSCNEGSKRMRCAASIHDQHHEVMVKCNKWSVTIRFIVT